MALHKAQRLGVDKRTQHRLHRLGNELAQLVGPPPGEDEQSVLRTPSNRLVAGAADDEEQLPRRRVQKLAAGDQATLTERAGEREGRRPAASASSRPG
jgi:hypothetical protein